MHKISLWLVFVLTLSFGFSQGDPFGTAFSYASAAAEASREGGIDVQYNWDFSKGGDEWLSGAVNSIGRADITGGTLVLDCSGFDPYIFSPETEVEADKFTDIIIKMRMSAGAGDAIFFITEEDKNWNENKKVQADFAGDNEWHIYKMDMSSSKFWKGKVTGFRLDLPNEGKLKCEIAYIKVATKEKKFVVPALPLLLASAGETKQVKIAFSCGGDNAKNITAGLVLPKELSLSGGQAAQSIPELKARQDASVSWNIKCGSPGINPFKVNFTSENIPAASVSGSIFVVNKTPSFAGAVPQKPGAYTDTEGNLVIENQKMRIAFVKDAPGYMRYLVYTVDEKGWFLLGTGYPMGSIAFLSRTQEQVLFIVPQSAQVTKNDGKTAQAQFSGQLKDAEGSAWDYSITFTLDADKTYAAVRHEIKCSVEKQVLKFCGPFIYAGEGSFKGAKTEAMLPGLEWLTAEETSSSQLDAAPPYSARFVSHPYRITVPVMTVEYEKHTLGLIWDPMQKWDGENAYPSAKFCSPNWIEAQDNHQMGLFVPSIPKWVKENGDKASVPYSLKPLSSLTLSSFILAEYPLKPLYSIQRYFDIFGAPALQDKPMTYEQEIDLIRETYMQRLWDKTAKSWHYAFPIKSEGFIGAFVGPGYHSRYALTLWMDYLFNRDAGVKKSIKDQVDVAMQEFYDDYGPGEASIELALRRGCPEEAVISQAHRMKGSVRSQKKEGYWSGFLPDKTTSVLGKRGQQEVGYIAGNAAGLLRFARMTGNQECIDAGVKALEYMKNNLTIPRAAQTWECPVHSPDIYASFMAVDACVEGYRATGNREWIEQAKYWAWTGLPFTYFWGAPDRPVMKYGTIPIFGASFYTVSWFGRPVQWNGMEYSYALLHLAEYDNSFPWKTVAEGIMLSGMHQQEKDGSAKGGYTDNWLLVENARCVDFILSPWWIALNLYPLIGEDMDVRTVILETGGGKAHINSAAHIEDAKMAGKTLSFALNYPQGETYYSFVSCVNKPSEVKNNGTAMKEIADLGAGAEGWKYDTITGSVFIKTVESEHGSRIEIAPLKVLTGLGLPAGSPPRFIPKKQRDMAAKPFKAVYDWDFTKGDMLGFHDPNDLEEPDVSSGKLALKASGPDPWIFSPPLEVDAEEYRYIIVSMRSSGSKQFELYFITEDSKEYSGDMVIFTPRLGTEEHTYIVDMAKCKKWAGKVTGLRFDPAGPMDKATVGTQIEVYSIKIANKPR